MAHGLERHQRAFTFIRSGSVPHVQAAESWNTDPGAHAVATLRTFLQSRLDHRKATAETRARGWPPGPAAGAGVNAPSARTAPRGAGLCAGGRRRTGTGRAEARTVPRPDPTPGHQAARCRATSPTISR